MGVAEANTRALPIFGLGFWAASLRDVVGVVGGECACAGGSAPWECRYATYSTLGVKIDPSSYESSSRP